jgi:hypothetical protein
MSDLRVSEKEVDVVEETFSPDFWEIQRTLGLGVTRFLEVQLHC